VKFLQLQIVETLASKAYENITKYSEPFKNLRRKLKQTFYTPTFIDKNFELNI